MSRKFIITHRLRAPVRGLAVATKRVIAAVAPKPKHLAPAQTHLHPAFATDDTPYGRNDLLVAEDGTMFLVPHAILIDVAPGFFKVANQLPFWNFHYGADDHRVIYVPDVEPNALALVLSMIVHRDEDDEWATDHSVAGNAAIELFLDCIHAALLYRLPFIERLYTAIKAHKDTFLVCPFLRCFLACAMQDDQMVRQYAWRTLPLKLSGMHPQLKEMWKTRMPHAYFEFTVFHKQFHRPAKRMIKALRSSVVPGPHNGDFSKKCRRHEREVLIDDTPCRSIVEFERDWRRARDTAAQMLTTHLFTQWVQWEMFTWTCAAIYHLIEDMSETRWCGNCQKSMARTFFGILVGRFGMDLAIVEEAYYDRPLFHVLRTARIRWKDGQADLTV